MLLDSAKGVETQTIKLFKALQPGAGIPIFTFINKMDRYGKEPLALLEELETGAGHPLLPHEMADRHGRRIQRYLPIASTIVSNCTAADSQRGFFYPKESGLDDPAIRVTVGDALYDRLREDIDSAGHCR
jgi:peptide chain release factor 3